MNCDICNSENTIKTMEGVLICKNCGNITIDEKKFNIKDPDYDKFRDFIIDNIDKFADHTQFRYWLYYNLKDCEFGITSPLTTGTVPNPHNWFPYTSDIIFYKLEQHEKVDDLEYYIENPDDFVTDYQEYINEIFDTLKKLINKIKTETYTL